MPASVSRALTKCFQARSTVSLPTGNPRARVVPGCGEQRIVPLAEDFRAVRAAPVARLAMVGQNAAGVYLADTGVEGRERHQRWNNDDGAAVLVPPRNDCTHACDHARLRQGVEVVHSTWIEQFRLDDERPHALSGVLARVAAIAALHNACISINRSLGRADLAFADRVGW
jgi:hypothetical protein